MHFEGYKLRRSSKTSMFHWATVKTCIYQTRCELMLKCIANKYFGCLGILKRILLFLKPEKM